MHLRMKIKSAGSRLERGQRAKGQDKREPRTGVLDLPPLPPAEEGSPFPSQRAFIGGKIVWFDGKGWRG